MAKEKLKRELGFRDLTLYYVVSGIGVRWISTAAASGESAIAVWLIAWCALFLPLVACILELSSRYPQEGGLYVWTRQAYGEFAGFMAAWTYWMSNLPFFPAVLYFAAGSVLFAFPHAQQLSGSRIYYTVFTASALALITALHVMGLKAGKWINNLGAMGVALPILALFSVALLSYFRFGSATYFTAANMTPRANLKNLIFWSTIFFAFGGCESASFMGEEIRNSRRTVPRALLTAGVIITVCYIAGTAALLVALPAARIAGLSGFMTAIDVLCRHLGVAGLIAPVALLVAIGNVGGVGAFLSSTARLPFVAGVDHYLPPVLGRIHPRTGAPYVALIAYGVAGILFGLLSQAGTSVEAAYDLLVSMGIVTYFIPFLFLFSSMIRLQSQPAPPGVVRLPGGKPVAIVLASIGLLSTSIAIAFSLFPAEDEAHPLAALLKILGTTAVLLAAGAGVYRYGQRRRFQTG